MADRLYLSLWYPNFRLEALPDALLGVLRQFAQVGAKRVSAASAYPLNFTESPTYQRIYVVDDRATQIDPFAPIDPASESDDLLLEAAVAEATEQLHDDMAYEFEVRWQLWTPVGQQPLFDRLGRAPNRDSDEEDIDPDDSSLDQLDSSWRMRSHTVRILGFGPSFDVAGYEQNGQLLVDFGIDTPWVPDHPLSKPSPQTPEEEALDETTQIHTQQNVEKLLAFTLLVEKNCGISSRLLWTESGKPLAEKLIARLQRVH
ncbi:MAG TPA: hypothetical protein VMQ60_11355 [Acidobacteriaceae bacterium]|jgi:hypothetical protein|nr:hypothetical protein [Acidobacteriaceae bacterium]